MKRDSSINKSIGIQIFKQAFAKNRGNFFPIF